MHHFALTHQAQLTFIFRWTTSQEDTNIFKYNVEQYITQFNKIVVSIIATFHVYFNSTIGVMSNIQIT
jgi:hypothetical protein